MLIIKKYKWWFGIKAILISALILTLPKGHHTETCKGATSFTVWLPSATRGSCVANQKCCMLICNNFLFHAGSQKKSKIGNFLFEGAYKSKRIYCTSKSDTHTHLYTNTYVCVQNFTKFAGVKALYASSVLMGSLAQSCWGPNKKICELPVSTYAPFTPHLQYLHHTAQKQNHHAPPGEKLQFRRTLSPSSGERTEMQAVGSKINTLLTAFKLNKIKRYKGMYVRMYVCMDGCIKASVWNTTRWDS